MTAKHCDLRFAKNAGSSSAFELAIRFTDWAATVAPERLSHTAIQSRWNVSRATAYRWLAAYRAARGLAA